MSRAGDARRPQPQAALPLDVRLMRRTTQWLLLAFVLLALAALARWLAWHPVFAIRGITVVGDVQHVSVAMLRTQVLPKLQGTFITVDLNEVRQAFEDVPWVRRAMVQREFPNRLRVVLQEHEAAAYWGEEGESTLLNTQGEVFEANPGELEQEDLPRLHGPRERSAQVLAMYRRLQPLFAARELPIDELALTRRGHWRVQLASGAVIELGGGEDAEVLARVDQFLGTVAQVAAHHQRNLGAVEGADLRYAQGYALRLRAAVAHSAQDTVKRQ
ncbi:MAG: cell division protein FtsQ/DivIB [Hylemonella sp.]